MNELYTLNNTNLNTNTRQDTSLNTLYIFKDETEIHLDNIYSSLNSLQSSNIVNIENDIDTLQNKTANVENYSQGLTVNDTLMCMNIELVYMQGLTPPKIYFGDGSIQETGVKILNIKTL